MRRFANFYILLFLIDAGLSLTDELWSVFASPLHVFSGVRNLVAFLVIVLSMGVYTLLGIDRRLPKRVFLPLTLYAFWCALLLWPLLGMMPYETLGVTAAFGQVFIGGVAVITLRSFYGGTLLPEDHFRRPLFGWRNTLVFSGVNLLLLPLLLIYSLMATAGNYLDQETAGFMRLSPVGIYTSDRSYHHDGKVVRLVAMMHIARQGYFKELVLSLPAAKTVILTEGVTDQDRLLKARFNYGSLAGLVGLTSQETMHLDGNPVELDDLDVPDKLERDETKPDIVRADIDLNRFNPKTVEFLNVLGRTLLGSKPLAQGLVEYNDWAQAKATPEWVSGLKADILDKRNAVVIDALERSLEHYDTIVIAWGAMHMPAIEAALLERGFVPGDKKERLVFAFSAIPYAKLWQKVSAPAEQAGDLRKSEGAGAAD
jgi:hypothetical protein